MPYEIVPALSSIARRIRTMSPRDWEEVEDSLSRFAFDLFKEFYADRNAVQEFAKPEP